MRTQNVRTRHIVPAADQKHKRTLICLIGRVILGASFLNFNEDPCAPFSPLWPFSL